MQQLSLFEQVTAVATRAEDWPVSHRTAGRGYIASAYVDGVGLLTSRSNSLWTAVQAVRLQVAAALAVQPDTLF